MREGYDARYLTEGIRALTTDLSLDVLVLDTHPGLNEETLLSLVISDALLIIMRPDRQDYEGTGITARVAKELQVPKIQLLVNKAPESLDHAQIAQQVGGGVRLSGGCRAAALGRHDAPRVGGPVRPALSRIIPVSDIYRTVAERSRSVT